MLTVRRRLEMIVVMAIAAGACLHQRQAVAGPRPAPEPWCTVPGRALDRTFIIDQARAALMKEGALGHMELSPDSVIPIFSRHDVYEGSIVRMLVSEPRGIWGGGGLVWVQAETGCAVVLTRYE